MKKLLPYGKTALAAVVALAVLGIYLWAMFRPGVWLRDAFLYRRQDGSFSGKDAYAYYAMQLTRTEDGAEVQFALDGETKTYHILADPVPGAWSTPDVKIYEGEKLLFEGEAQGDPGDALLWNAEDDALADGVNVIVNGSYQKSDLWPTCNWLYNVAIGGRQETRGNAYFLILLGVLALLLVLDIRFPLLFWTLNHRLEVSGGEPSAWYYTSQRIGRIILVGGMAVTAGMSFFVH